MIFTKQELTNLSALLSRAAKPEEALTVNELEGFLYCLAITPDMVMPSEWLPAVFGEEMAEFSGQDEADRMLGHLFTAYNRFSMLKDNGKLAFPFDMRRLVEEDILEDIEEWTRGFERAMRLRPDLWAPEGDESEDESLAEPDPYTASFAIVLGIANPDDIPELFPKHQEVDEARNRDNNLLHARLFACLPEAIKRLQENAARLDEERRSIFHAPAPTKARRVVKVGRNDPCPCGSGKKYKKCCGGN